MKGWNFLRYRPKIVMCEFMDSRMEEFFGYSYDDVVTYIADYGCSGCVSEWSPVSEYARRGIETTRSVHLGLFSGELDHEPSWGNLFFVLESDTRWFEETAIRYLTDLHGSAWTLLNAASRERAANIDMKSTLAHRETRIGRLIESTSRLAGRIADLETAIVQRVEKIERLQSTITPSD